MKEGGTKFFHALVYYGQKRESVLTLKPKINVKKAREKCKEKCAVRNGTLRQR